MTDSKKSALRQMDRAETDALALMVLRYHEVRLVTRDMGVPGFACSCGAGFPFFGDQMRGHVILAIGEAARCEDATPHPSWGGFAQPEADAPAGLAADMLPVPRWAVEDAIKWLKRESIAIGLINLLQGILDAKVTVPDASERAVALISDLTALLKADSFPVAAGSAVLRRAEAFLGEVDPIDMPFTEPGPAIGGAFEDREPPTVYENDRPGALVSLSFAEMRLARKLAETHAEIIDDGRGSRDFTLAHDIGIKMRDGMMHAAVDLAYEELQDAQRATGTHGEVLELLDEVMGKR